MALAQGGPAATTTAGSSVPRLPLPALLLMAALLGLTAFVYAKALRFWYVEWTAEGSYYAHGVFIPFFVGLMIWRDKERLRRLPMRTSWWGLPLVVVALLAVLYGERADSRIATSISFVVMLIGASLLMAGPRITRALLFPFLFLLTMIPLIPDQIIGRIAFPIQLLSAKLSSGLLGLMSFENTRTGTTIAMANYRLDVELPCSGFKTLMGLMAFSAAFAWLVEAATWKRWVLFASAIPISIIVNTVRITLIGVVGEVFSSKAAHLFHDYSGFIVLIFGFLVLFNLAQWLKCRKLMGWTLYEPKGPEGAAETPAVAADDKAQAETVRRAQMDARYGPPRTDTLRRLCVGAVPVLVLMLLAAGARARVQPPTAATPAIKSADIPATLDNGRWTQLGDEAGPDAYIQKELKPEFWATRNYITTSGSKGLVEVLINGGMSRHTFHDPHDCFPASGWGFRYAPVANVETPHGPVRATVSEATDDKGETYLVMYFWVMDGKVVTTSSDFQLQLVTRSVLGDSRRPSYFIRFRQLQSGTDPVRHGELTGIMRALWTEIAPKVADVQPRTAAATP